MKKGFYDVQHIYGPSDADDTSHRFSNHLDGNSISSLWIQIPYTAKLSSEKTFAVRVQNFHSRGNFHDSMFVDLHCQLTRP